MFVLHCISGTNNFNIHKTSTHEKFWHNGKTKKKLNFSKISITKVIWLYPNKFAILQKVCTTFYLWRHAAKHNRVIPNRNTSSAHYAILHLRHRVTVAYLNIELEVLPLTESGVLVAERKIKFANWLKSSTAPRPLQKSFLCSPRARVCSSVSRHEKIWMSACARTRVKNFFSLFHSLFPVRVKKFGANLPLKELSERLPP